MKNLLNLLGFLACMLIGVFTATGDVQSFIHFSGVANEMAFCFLSFMMAAVFMLSAILPDEKKKNKRQHGFE
jgi:amino acid transporter